MILRKWFTEWKDIKGYEGLYQVSNHGEVRNLKKGRLVKQSIQTKGYLMATWTWKSLEMV